MHWLPTSVCLSSIHPLSVPWLYQRMHAALHNRGGGHRRSTCHPLSDRIDSASASAYQPIYLGFGVAVTAPFSGKYSHRPAFYYSDDTLLFTWVVLIMKLMLHHLLAPSESHTIIWFLYIFYFHVVSSRFGRDLFVVCSDHKLTQLLRESLGSATCNTCAIIHVSPASAAYSDSLQVMQLASRMHQTRLRRRPKVCVDVVCRCVV